MSRPHAEEPVRFDDFEAFVHQGGGIDGDALAHLPIWMRQGLFWCDARKFRERQFAKRATRGGEDQAADFGGFPAAQALVNGVVFAVDRQQRDFAALYGGHDHFAGGDQNFFVGQRDVFAELDRFVGGGQADHADGGGDYDFGVGMGGDTIHAFRAEQNFRHRQACCFRSGPSAWRF